MKRINVAMLFGLKDPGGLGNHVKNLSIALAKSENINLHVVDVGNEDNVLERFAKRYGFSYHLIKNKASLKKTTASLFSTYLYYPILILRKIIEIKPDIVHIQGSQPLGAVIGVLLGGILRKTPVVLTVHGINKIAVKYGESKHTGIKRVINSLIEDRLFSCIPPIIVVSPHLKQYITQKANSKTYIIPNGINYYKLQSMRGNSNFKLKNSSVFFIGRLTEIKGVDILLKAVPIVKREIPEIKVYIAGDGPLKKELIDMTKKLNIENNVEFLGFISENEKNSYLKSVDICAFPSRYEPFGIVLLEAMACKRPVIGSKVGGIPFVIEDKKTGLLFEKDNIEELAEKIIFLLNNKKIRWKMGKMGEDRAKKFTWEKVAQMTVSLYKEILYSSNMRN